LQYYDRDLKQKKIIVGIPSGFQGAAWQAQQFDKLPFAALEKNRT
jgi:hypothetical protein